MKKNSIFSEERKEDLEKMMSRVRELLFENAEDDTNGVAKNTKETTTEIEEEIHLEKDAIGRTVLAEENDDTEENPREQEENSNSEDTNNDEDVQNKDDDKTEGLTDDKEREEEKGPLKPGETTHLQSFDELFKETNTKLKIQKETSEPSPLFGENMKDHNKYKITLTNDKGGDLTWYYWDSEKNTENKVVPTTEMIMKDFGKKLESVVVGISFENFKKEYGYDNVEESLAQKQYEAMRKLKDSIKKIFPDQHNVYQLIQLSKKD